MSDLKSSRTLAASHLQQASEIINYVFELKDIFGNLIVQTNRSEAQEALKIPPQVRKSFSFAPLFSPIITFGVDFYPDLNNPESFALLKVYLDLQELFEYVRFTKEVDKFARFRPFFIDNDPKAVATALKQMHNYLEVIHQNLFNIYSYAVGYFYGTDMTSQAIEYRELSPDYPYIRDRQSRLPSGILFAYFIVSAIEHYYAPKLR